MKTVIERIILLGLVAICLLPILSSTPSTARQVEVRRATRATQQEVARANEIENARLQISNAKTLVGKAKRQRAYEKGVTKRQSKQIYALNKSVKVARNEKARAEKRLADKEREVQVLQGTLKHKAWKRTHWFMWSAVFVVAAGVVSFVFGVLVGSIFRRPRPDPPAVYTYPPAPPYVPPAPPAPTGGQVISTHPPSFIHDPTPQPDSLVQVTTPSGKPVNANDPEAPVAPKPQAPA